MKHDGNTFSGSVFTETLVDVFSATTRTIGSVASKLRKGASSCLLQLQIARMESVLNSMTAAQLKQINLERCDIRSRAEYLISYEYDGL